jgi:hypothetical protein
MILRTRLGRLRNVKDRGAVAVEAAIITPILLLLLIGILEFGFAYKDQLAITSAVRAGARIASAEPRSASFATDAAAQVAREGAALDLSDVKALWVYQADATGHPEGAGGTFNSCSTNCIQFAWSSASGGFVTSGGSWPATSQDACAGEENSIGVYLAYNHDPLTHVIFGNTITLSSYTSMVLEPFASVNNAGCK